jgi:CO dehydrogenase maturation factor
MPPPSAEQINARHAWAVDALDRRMAIVEGLAGTAREPLEWLAVRRQVQSFLGYAAPGHWPRPDALLPAYASHIAALEVIEARAVEALGAVEPDALAAARRRLGLRLALIGKGGAGKTVISSTLVRILARRGRKVFAVDLDTCPGLAFGLGIPVTDAGLPDEALEEQPAAPYGWQLAGGLSPDEAVERFSAEDPEGIRFLGLGKIGSVDKDTARKSVAAVRQILQGFSAPDTDVIADLEAGPTTPFESYHEFSTDVVVVVGPAWRSAMTARRLLPMVGERRLTIVANRFRDEPDHPGLPPAIRIPFDPELTQAEREGRSPFEACPDSPAVEAIGRLADLLLEQSAAGEVGKDLGT